LNSIEEESRRRIADSVANAETSWQPFFPSDLWRYLQFNRRNQIRRRQSVEAAITPPPLRRDAIIMLDYAVFNIHRLRSIHERGVRRAAGNNRPTTTVLLTLTTLMQIDRKQSAPDAILPGIPAGENARLFRPTRIVSRPRRLSRKESDRMENRDEKKETIAERTGEPGQRTMKRRDHADDCT